MQLAQGPTVPPYLPGICTVCPQALRTSCLPSPLKDSALPSPTTQGIHSAPPLWCLPWLSLALHSVSSHTSGQPTGPFVHISHPLCTLRLIHLGAGSRRDNNPQFSWPRTLHIWPDESPPNLSLHHQGICGCFSENPVVWVLTVLLAAPRPLAALECQLCSILRAWAWRDRHPEAALAGCLGSL